ncbi:DamX-related protein [Veronia nyctiphanis]|uniref:DamX-related protein n=1 Tax=Veronia nyctiphanis TaxID=1278244 RepID=A0A4Q0YUT8_9GAMM|nr:SPOR domain-containing protein [Veronia nyctiphanis]RXJ74585.1 DamX-related protein [Veronia nyctiphanis]
MKITVLFLCVLTMVGCADRTQQLVLLSQTEEITSTEQPKVAVPKPAESQMTEVKQPTVKTAAKKITKPKKKVESTRYTIQVVALSYKSGLKGYADMLPSDQPLWSNMKKIDGLPWYTLLYGSFPSKQSASKKLNALPNIIKEQKPFIRSISSIKKSANPDMVKIN